MSIIKEVGLPKRPPQGRNDEGQDLSERVPPPRSSSPVIGSPPVRAVPIGTPPKQPMSHALNHQVNRQKTGVLLFIHGFLIGVFPPSFPLFTLSEQSAHHSVSLDTTTKGLDIGL